MVEGICLCCDVMLSYRAASNLTFGINKVVSYQSLCGHICRPCSGRKPLDYDHVSKYSPSATLSGYNLGKVTPTSWLRALVDPCSGSESLAAMFLSDEALKFCADKMTGAWLPSRTCLQPPAPLHSTPGGLAPALSYLRNGRRCSCQKQPAAQHCVLR